MYKKVLVRVNKKLLHAQIVLIWVKILNIERIIIVDDELSSNKVFEEIYRLALPEHIIINIYSEKYFIESHRDESIYKYSSNTLILIRSINSLLDILSAGVHIQEVQIALEEGDYVHQKNTREEIKETLLEHYAEDDMNTTFYQQNSPYETRKYL